MTTPEPLDPLKTLLTPLQIRGSEAFVHQVMRRVRAVEAPASSWAWAWPRWAMPTLAFSMIGFGLTLGVTLRPEPASADSLLSPTSQTSEIATELEEWWVGVEGAQR